MSSKVNSVLHKTVEAMYEFWGEGRGRGQERKTASMGRCRIRFASFSCTDVSCRPRPHHGSSAKETAIAVMLSVEPKSKQCNRSASTSSASCSVPSLVLPASKKSRQKRAAAGASITSQIPSHAKSRMLTVPLPFWGRANTWTSVSESPRHLDAILVAVRCRVHDGRGAVVRHNHFMPGVLYPLLLARQVRLVLQGDHAHVDVLPRLAILDQRCAAVPDVADGNVLIKHNGKDARAARVVQRLASILVRLHPRLLPQLRFQAFAAFQEQRLQGLFRLITLRNALRPRARRQACGRALICEKLGREVAGMAVKHAEQARVRSSQRPGRLGREIGKRRAHADGVFHVHAPSRNVAVPEGNAVVLHHCFCVVVAIVSPVQRLSWSDGRVALFEEQVFDAGHRLPSRERREAHGRASQQIDGGAPPLHF
eukprot:scaffold1085_cov252-Pinguiococcus_pyrenoidosus.AAC.19